MKRKKIKYIEDIKSRSGNFMYSPILSSEIEQLEILFNKPYPAEMSQYFIIKIVAFFESYFKMAIKELIDYGSPYVENSMKLLKDDNKFDFESVQAMYGKKITLGELIASQMKINNFEDIESKISILFGDSFKKRLISIDLSKNRDANTVSKLSGDDINKVIGFVNKTYELRHIFCHEVAPAFKPEQALLKDCFSCSVLFLKASMHLVTSLLYPEYNQSQTELRINADKEFKKNDQRLNDIIQSFNELPVTAKAKTAFKRMHNAWEKYRLLEARLESLPYEGGSAQPYVNSVVLNSITSRRISELKEIYNNFNYK